MVTGKDTSNPFIFNDPPLTEVNTSGSDENKLKLKLMYICHYYNQDLLLIIKDKEKSKVQKQTRSTLKNLDISYNIFSRLKRRTKKLEHKQVEFKLGEDCWDMISGGTGNK